MRLKGFFFLVHAFLVSAHAEVDCFLISEVYAHFRSPQYVQLVFSALFFFSYAEKEASLQLSLRA